MKALATSILLGFFALVSTASADHHKGEKKDIVDTAVAAGSFKTLAAALGAADLVDTMKGKGPFTVFAPTDEAFAKLPKETLACCSSQRTRTSSLPSSPTMLFRVK
jgi:uncharacterized surface protein with fasciclin (FAS1) repeats